MSIGESGLGRSQGGPLGHLGSIGLQYTTIAP